jgi:hypothetical protein
MMQNATSTLHKYVLGLMGLMITFGATVPIAMIRVSNTPKFALQPFNSQTCDSKQPADRIVTSWIAACSRMSADPIAPKAVVTTKPTAIAPILMVSPNASSTNPKQ